MPASQSPSYLASLPFSAHSTNILLPALPAAHREVMGGSHQGLLPHNPGSSSKFSILQGTSCSRAFGPGAAARVRGHCCVRLGPWGAGGGQVSCFLVSGLLYTPQN